MLCYISRSHHFSRHHDLIIRYGIFMSQMITGIQTMDPTQLIILRGLLRYIKIIKKTIHYKNKTLFRS